jgi:hypothetical protein
VAGKETQNSTSILGSEQQQQQQPTDVQSNVCMHEKRGFSDAVEFGAYCVCVLEFPKKKKHQLDDNAASVNADDSTVKKRLNFSSCRL